MAAHSIETIPTKSILSMYAQLIVNGYIDFHILIGPWLGCTFSPWNGLTAHQPLGAINQMRKAVYEASALQKKLPFPFATE